jgi:hypothetical protein
MNNTNDNEIKSRIAAYRKARKAFDDAESDDCLDEALDALDAADDLVREVVAFFGNTDPHPHGETMTLTVKLVNPERALSQMDPAWYADGSDERAFVGEVALGDRCLYIYVDGRLRGHGPNGPIRNGDALREVCVCDDDMQISGETEEISIKETPWFMIEGDAADEYQRACFDSLADAVEGAVAYLKTGDFAAERGEEVAGLLAGALKFEPEPEPEPGQAVVWEPASAAETHVLIRYTEEDPPKEWEIVSNDSTEIAQFMAKRLRNWCVDDEIEITINGEHY